MHAEMRRMPAQERARHGKRLGHVQNGSGPAPLVLAGNQPGNGKTTASQDTKGPTVTPASTTEKSSSSSSLTPSSTAVPPPSSASSASAPPSSPPAPSSQALVQTSTSVVVISASSSPSTTSTAQTDATPPSSSGLSSGAIAGIVAIGLIASVALVVFFVRKTYLRRRQGKRISWNGSPRFGMKDDIGHARISGDPKPLPGIPTSFNQEATPTLVSGGLQRGSLTSYPQLVSRPSSTQPQAQYAVPSPPPASYNNPVTVPQPQTTVLAMAWAAASSSLPSPVHYSRGQTQEMPCAMVKCMFVPNLPDELFITMGERVRINAQYDDGWALCENSRGEHGMVPLECLEHIVTDQMDWRNMKRASSLNPDARRF